jgi:Janus kinase 2
VQHSGISHLTNFQYFKLIITFFLKFSSSPSLKLHPPRDLSLKLLNELKIHGPIGGTYSYSKLEDRNSDVGTFIIRQCEKNYETFYIDIVTKENQTETFKIFYDGTNDVDEWRLIENDNDKGTVFTNLIDLAKSIPLDGRSKYFRLQPSPHDKSPLLLLCQTSAKMMSTTAAMSSTTLSGLKGKNPTLLNAADDLLLYKKEQRDYSDRIFTRMKAELNKASGRKKTNVTLKILKQSEVSTRLTDFCKLADWWGKLDLSEIVRLHGITLHQPIALVLESISHGPLDEFLRSHKDKINLLNLVETATSLAKALHYLVSMIAPDLHFN